MTQVSAPHLKSEASFLFQFARESAGNGILFLAACFVGGGSYLFSAGLFFIVLFLGEFIFRILGKAPAPKWDPGLLNQGLLAVLFFPENISLKMCGLGAFVLAAFYRLSGGRNGYVLQPACLTLAFWMGLGLSPGWMLISLPLFPSMLLFLIWFVIQKPHTKVELRRVAVILTAGVLIAVLHEMSWFAALLWCTAAGEILFDRALVPLAMRGRLWFYGTMLILFALLAASGLRSEAIVIAGTTSGFFAAWIERRALMRRRA